MSIPIDVKTAPSSTPELIDPEKGTATGTSQPPPSGGPHEIPIPLELLDTHPGFVQCPFCNVQARTEVTYTSSGSTHAMGLGCCCLLGIFGVWMPYVFHWGSNVDHSCFACKRPLVHIENSTGARRINRPATTMNGNGNEKQGGYAMGPQGMNVNLNGEGNGEVKSEGMQGQMQGEVRGGGMGNGGENGQMMGIEQAPAYVESLPRLEGQMQQQQQEVHTEVKSPVFMPSAC